MSRIVNWAAGLAEANTPNPGHYQPKLPGMEHLATAHPVLENSRSFLRFGHWPENEQSRNHATGDLEDGVSVYEMHPHTNMPMDPDPHLQHPGSEWSRQEMNDRVRRHVKGSDSDQGYEVKGDDGWGFGHDGEPLIRKVKHHRDWDGGAARRHDAHVERQRWEG